MSTEQTATTITASEVNQLVGELRIRAVQLAGSSFELTIPPEFVKPAELEWKVDFAYNTDVGRDDASNAREVFCFVGTSVEGTAKIDSPLYPNLPEGLVLKGACSFVVRYLLKAPMPVSDELALELAKSQGAMNAIPYIRHYLDTQFNQMGIQGVLLPLFRRKPKPESAGTE